MTDGTFWLLMGVTASVLLLAVAFLVIMATAGPAVARPAGGSISVTRLDALLRIIEGKSVPADSADALLSLASIVLKRGPSDNEFNSTGPDGLVIPHLDGEKTPTQVEGWPSTAKAEAINAAVKETRMLGESGETFAAAVRLARLYTESALALGPDSEYALAVGRSLARYLGESGQIREAVDLLVDLRDRSITTLGLSARDTIATRHALARWTGESGRLDEAIAQLNQLVAESSEAFGADDPTTLAIRHNLAYLHGLAGEADRALDEFSHLARITERALGPENEGTLDAHYNLAYLLAASGRFAEASEIFTSLIQEYTSVLGRDHPRTGKARRQLESLRVSASRVPTPSRQLERHESR